MNVSKIMLLVWVGAGFGILACENFTYSSCADCSPRNVCLAQYDGGSHYVIGGTDPAFPTGKQSSMSGWNAGEIMQNGTWEIYCTFTEFKQWWAPNNNCQGSPNLDALNGRSVCSTNSPKYTVNVEVDCGS